MKEPTDPPLSESLREALSHCYADDSGVVLRFSHVTPPELESFASGEACSTCDGAGDIFTNPTWNNDPQFEEDHPCPACGGAGVDPGRRWPTP